MLKVFLVLCLTVAALQFASSIPISNKNADLEKSFVDFLRQDKEFQALLASNGGRGANFEGMRHIRSVEDDFEESDMGANGAQEPGFFDRAAKFVMEVLQRFLKWINTDN